MMRMCQVVPRKDMVDTGLIFKSLCHMLIGQWNMQITYMEIEACMFKQILIF